MKEIIIKIPDDIQLTAGVITILYQDINGDMNRSGVKQVPFHSKIVSLKIIE